MKRILLLIALLTAFGNAAATGYFPKERTAGTGTFDMSFCYSLNWGASLDFEAGDLRDSLNALRISEGDDCGEIWLEVASLGLPIRESKHRAELLRDGYEIVVKSDGVRVRGNSPAAVYYGCQAFVRLIDANQSIPCQTIRDWPDMPIRMLMIDPARQNENFDYYRRFIQFAAQHGTNAILVHLTDDQTSALYDADYPELMHPHAWKPEETRALVAYAKQYHIELIPEIESFGHSKMFQRRADAADYLMKNGKKLTNVLSPASEKTYEYLDSIYSIAARDFDSPTLHVGCDEVKWVEDPLVAAAFPGMSKEQIFRAHMLRCRDLAAKHGKTVAYWGDMLLSHPAILDDLPTSGTMIYDWQYQAKVDGSSSTAFTNCGFEVIACPALMCSPHMILPNHDNFTNIRNFAKAAREQDLAGINTTIWIPTRYLSDSMWPGIGYACEEAWCGSRLEEDEFYRRFAQDFFGFDERWDQDAFLLLWKNACEAAPTVKDFDKWTWHDEASLESCFQTIAKDEVKLSEVRALLNAARGLQAPAHEEELDAIMDNVRIEGMLINHYQACCMYDGKRAVIGGHLLYNLSIFTPLVDKDWDRNRYADDPNKEGKFTDFQSLRYRFHQMQEFLESQQK
ncbi:hypothetical protein BH09SUM1_BH09SUM1_28340 [soil metagenome]